MAFIIHFNAVYSNDLVPVCSQIQGSFHMVHLFEVFYVRQVVFYIYLNSSVYLSLSLYGNASLHVPARHPSPDAYQSVTMLLIKLMIT